jgi:hypothetical protein
MKLPPKENFLYFSHAQSYISKSATVPNPLRMRFLRFPMKILSSKGGLNLLVPLDG